MEVTQCQTSAYFVERQHLLGTQSLFALQLFTLVGYFTGFLFGLDYVERITGSGSTVQTQYQSRFGRTCLFHALVTFVEHSLHLPITCTSQHDITHLQGTVGYQHRSHVTASLIQRRFDDRTGSAAVRICLQVEHLSLQQHFLHQFGHTYTLLG